MPRIFPKALEPSSPCCLSAPFWNIPSLAAPISASLPRALTQAQLPPLPSASPGRPSLCVHLFPSPTLLPSVSHPSIPLSESLSVPLASLGLSLCLPVSLSVVPRNFSEPAGDSPALHPRSAPSCPSPSTGGPPHRPLSLTLGGHAPPAAQCQPPSQRDPAHPPGTSRLLCQTFPRSCWAHRGGGGRAGLSPALPPAPGSRALALSDCPGGDPSPVPLGGGFSASRPLLSLPDLAKPLPRPWLPLPPPTPARSTGGTWTSRG